MYGLERLAQGIPFEVLDQLGDSVWIGPGFATVVAGSQSVGIVSLIDKGAGRGGEVALASRTLSWL